LSDRLGSGCNAADEAPEFGTVGAEECDAFVHRTFLFPQRVVKVFFLKTFFSSKKIVFFGIFYPQPTKQSAESNGTMGL